MPRERGSFKTVLKDVLGGAALGGVVAIVAALRELNRTRPAPEGSEQTMDAGRPQMAGAEELVAGDESSDLAAADEWSAPAPEPRPGWEAVEREPLPRPTYWPAALAFGIVLLAWGIVTSWIITGVGVIVLAVALAGWIGELRHGH